MNKQFNLRFFQVALIVFIAVLIGYVIGSQKITRAFSPAAAIKSGPVNKQDLDMTLFYDVLSKVNEKYYDDKQINSKKILEGAISGMLQSLDDPYTSYFPAKENSSFKEQMAGEFQGIGAELALNDDKQITVVSPIDGSPAMSAGIKPGDIIAAVDGKDTQGWTLPQAVEKIRGPKGSAVTLTVLHEGDNKLTDVKLTRDVINVKSVTSWVKNMNCNGAECVEVAAPCPTCSTIAYIRLSQFGDKTNNEWIENVSDVSNKLQGQKPKAVILDLRNNPGGYLSDAVFVASEFLDRGIVVIQDNGKGQTDPLSVSRRGMFTNGGQYPLYVLINKGSASASEIVAGALRDYKRAQLVGETSFGKGTIQEAIEVGDGASVHLSVAKWLTPNSTWVHKKGLKPDLEIKYDATKSADMEIDNQLNELIKKVSK